MDTDLLNKPLLTTEEAAPFLLVKPQTMLAWSCMRTGPLSPVKIGRRLGWRTADILKLMGGEVETV